MRVSGRYIAFVSVTIFPSWILHIFQKMVPFFFIMLHSHTTLSSISAFRIKQHPDSSFSFIFSQHTFASLLHNIPFSREPVATYCTHSRSLHSADIVPPPYFIFPHRITPICSTGRYFSTMLSICTRFLSRYIRHAPPELNIIAVTKLLRWPPDLLRLHCISSTLPRSTVQRALGPLQRFCFCLNFPSFGSFSSPQKVLFSFIFASLAYHSTLHLFFQNQTLFRYHRFHHRFSAKFTGIAPIFLRLLGPSCDLQLSLTFTSLSRCGPTANFVFSHPFTPIRNIGCYFSTLISISMKINHALSGTHRQNRIPPLGKNFCAGRLIFLDYSTHPLVYYSLLLTETHWPLQPICFYSSFSVVQCYEERLFCEEHVKLEIREKVSK